jgi:hypothetical protein
MRFVPRRALTPSLMSESVNPAARRKFYGLISRRERWALTWRAWLILLGLGLAGGCLVVRGSHAFLAIDAPVSTTVMVVEGWVPRYAVTNYVARYHSNYTMIFTTGGATLADYASRDVSDTFASVVRSRLVRVGVPASKIQIVPCWLVERDRTYASAVALREWCRTNSVQLTAFNVITLGPHARRSRLLHQKAFGDGVKVGVIPLTNVEYDPDHWWRYSEGVKETMSEAAAYLYVRFLFSPK